MWTVKLSSHFSNSLRTPARRAEGGSFYASRVKGLFGFWKCSPRKLSCRKSSFMQWRLHCRSWNNNAPFSVTQSKDRLRVFLWNTFFSFWGVFWYGFEENDLRCGTRPLILFGSKYYALLKRRLGVSFILCDTPNTPFSNHLLNAYIMMSHIDFLERLLLFLTLTKGFFTLERQLWAFFCRKFPVAHCFCCETCFVVAISISWILEFITRISWGWRFVHECSYILA